MKKETAVAILIGLTLGLIITYGAYRARVALDKKPVHTAQTTTTASPSPDEATDQVITVHNPQNGTVQVEKKTTVTGVTRPLQYIVLFVNDTEYIRQSDDAGNFSFDVPLPSGSSILSILTSDANNKIVTVERVVIVADVSITEPTPTPSPSPKLAKATATPKPTATAKASPSPSADTTAASESTASVKQRIEKVLEKQKEQLSDILSTTNGKIIGFVGEVSRIAQSSLSVKHDDTTTILKMSDSVSIKRKDKKISLTDISVSDWVAVVGEQTEDAFEPRLLLVSATSLRPKTKLVTFATVSEIKKQQFVLTPRDTSQGESITLTIGKQTKFESIDGTPLKLADFQKDFTVLAIAQKQNENDAEYTLTTVRSLATKAKK